MIKRLMDKVRTVKYYTNIVGISGLMCAVRSKITRRPNLFEVVRNDILFPFYLRMGSSDIPTYKQVFYDQEYRFSVKEPPKVIIDAGANIGLTSIYFANKYPDAKIISIEPEKSNFELLEKNIKPYPNITSLHGALWSENEVLDILDPGLGKWGYITEKKSHNSADTVHEITAFTVDRIMRDYGLDKVDILKVDIEGAEKEVFNDTSAWIGKVDAVIIEIHDHSKAGCARSFYNGTPGFDHEWLQGELVYITKNKCLTEH